VLQLCFNGAGLWLDGIAVLGALVIGSAAGGWSRLSREHRGRGNLARYVSPSLAGLLSETARPAFDGREQEAGILFVDVAGYSGMVERESPAAIAAFLRELHALFEEAAERHGGVIVDFQGDGALMVFGLPDPSCDDAANALACAEALLAGRDRVQAEFLFGPVALRVSVHCGPVACAVLGGRRHAQVSVTGDAVNVTSRLQEVAKARGVALVATRAALDAAGSDHGMRPLGSEPLRGRRGEVEIWGRDDGPDPDTM
jgi:adenylate cyclase